MSHFIGGETEACRDPEISLWEGWSVKPGL